MIKPATTPVGIEWAADASGSSRYKQADTSIFGKTRSPRTWNYDSVRTLVAMITHLDEDQCGR